MSIETAVSGRGAAAASTTRGGRSGAPCAQPQLCAGGQQKVSLWLATTMLGHFPSPLLTLNDGHCGNLRPALASLLPHVHAKCVSRSAHLHAAHAVVCRALMQHATISLQLPVNAFLNDA